MKLLCIKQLLPKTLADVLDSCKQFSLKVVTFPTLCVGSPHGVRTTVPNRNLSSGLCRFIPLGNSQESVSGSLRIELPTLIY